MDSMRRGVAAVLALGVVCCAAAVHAATASVDSNGNVIVDGEPFFPIGIYHVSWIGNRQGNAQQVADFEAIADAGFNLVVPTVDLRPGMAAALDRAHARGLRVIAEIPWGESVITMWKDKPAIIGWLTADDFNSPFSGPPNHPPGTLSERRDLLATLVPQHLSYASGGSFPGYEIDAYAGTVDVMGFQSYPIDGQSTPTEYELQENMDGFDYVAAQLTGTDQTFVANPQAFKWSPGSFPTPEESRNLLFPPLIRGAKGVIYYTYWGENGVLASASPALWAELKRQVIELKTLTPFLLHGTLTPFATGNPRVHGAYWEHQNQIVAVVLNTHRTESYAVSLPLPAGDLGAAQALFPTRPESGMTIAANQLGGTIGPLEVHVYLIDVGTPGNVSPLADAVVSPAPIGIGDEVTFDASGSSDPDGSVVAWEWDFGDGETASGEEVTHTYATTGTRVARLTVRDDAGAPATAFVPVTVQLTGLCPPAPVAGCRAATRSSLSIKDRGRRTVKLKWSGAATTSGDFGDPSDDTSYALCIYDGDGLALATVALPSATKWSQNAAGDLRYKDAAGNPGGVTKIKLQPGTDGRARIQMLAKGGRVPSANLPLTLPVTAQVIRSGGPCWSATYPAAKLSTATKFKAS